MADAQDLESIASSLYALRPDAFAESRDEEVRKARAAGDRTLAQELTRLRRPTQSAWLVNLLWRDQREALEQLFTLSEGITQAMARASAGDLQRIAGLRRELEETLLRRARALGEEAGVAVTASTEREVQDTLSAALAVPEVAGEVRTGRLVKPAAYAGFGAAPAGMPSQPAAAAAGGAAARPRQGLAAAAERERETREKGQRRVEEAQAAVDAAARTLSEEEGRLDEARRHHEGLTVRLRQAEEQLRALRAEATAAERSAAGAEKRRGQAEKDHRAAVQALERAERAVGG